MKVQTAKQALELVRRHGLLSLTSIEGSSLPSLVELVIGVPVRGSWWAHPQGNLVYNIASAVEDSPHVLATKLCGGKVTFVHDALWPALFRVVTDPGYRKTVRARLGAAARKLADRVERGGELRVDELAAGADVSERRTLSKARQDLEKSLFCHGEQRHSDSGKHVTVLKSWELWATRDVERAATELSVEDALATLRRASKGARLGVELAEPRGVVEPSSPKAASPRRKRARS